MSAPIKDGVIYALADALGLDLDVNFNAGTVSGATRRTVKIGGLAMEVPLKVVDSLIGHKLCMLMLRSKGNLALLASVTPARPFDAMTLDLLNVAKMDRTPSKFFDAADKSLSVDEARARLTKAIVKSFKKISRNGWAEA